MQRLVNALLLSIAFIQLGTGCKTFKREAFERDIVSGVYDTLPKQPVQPGYRFRSLDMIEAGDLIVVSYRDTMSQRRTLAATYDKFNTTDTSLALAAVRDTGVPKTLSVAFSTVQQVYPVQKYESYVSTDAGLSLLWFFFGLPAIVFSSMLLSLLTASLLQSNEPQTSPYAGLGTAIGAGGLGLIAGVTTWILLTIPIR